jgi:hypothetical protein
MEFPYSVIQKAWIRSGGFCECNCETCEHTGRCYRYLHIDFRGSDYTGGWYAHHVTEGGSDTLNNCEILCQPCGKHKEKLKQKNNGATPVGVG